MFFFNNDSDIKQCLTTVFFLMFIFKEEEEEEEEDEEFNKSTQAIQREVADSLDWTQKRLPSRTASRSWGRGAR